MPALMIRFLCGRYHATAWGRNVNEGAPEWPPSPFRIARALLDIWYRRHEKIPEEAVKEALSLLSGSPRMSLPATASMAVKLYQDMGKKDGDRQPVIDASVCMHPGEVMFLELPEQASRQALGTLQTLASELNYLGRSESWIEASIVEKLPDEKEWNCLASENGTAVNTLRSETGYEDLPYRPKITADGQSRDMTWLEALTISTATLQAEGWNKHPLLGHAAYVLPEQRYKKPGRSCLASEPLCYTYALQSVPQPPVTQTLIMAERVRAGLMSKSRQITGDPEQVSPLFSGKDASGNPLKNHQHAFYWPCDLDGDGKIDHMKIIVPRAITPGERAAFEALKKIWSGGSDLGRLILLHAQPLAQREDALIVESVTPVVFGRHYKPRAGSFADWLVSEVRRSCAEVGIPEPVTVSPVPLLPCRDGAPIRWSEFVCQRKGERPTHGYGFRLTFSQPVKVPFAIGKMAHFGLGLFTAKK
ncbi:MAG: type I-U CRISPR-associated protein Cas5/Cas6 [bacterium]|nr:type I-U CRISPR-associated protein Cas5/Cas6 [bacterium]